MTNKNTFVAGSAGNQSTVPLLGRSSPLRASASQPVFVLTEHWELYEVEGVGNQLMTLSPNPSDVPAITECW